MPLISRYFLLETLFPEKLSAPKVPTAKLFSKHYAKADKNFKWPLSIKRISKLLQVSCGKKENYFQENQYTFSRKKVQKLKI